MLNDGQDEQGKPIKVPDAKFSLHAAAALWIEQGLSPKRIQTLMGPALIAQTFDQYGYLFEARDDEAAMMAGVEKGLLSKPTATSMQRGFPKSWITVTHFRTCNR